MKTITVDAKATEFDGETLPKAVPYSYKYDAFENKAEVLAAGENPSDADLLRFVNNKRKQNERNKALIAAMKAIGIEKKTIENSDKVRFRTIYDVLIAAKKSEAEATQMAAASLGLSDIPEDWL
jgi:hypothetical protein